MRVKRTIPLIFSLVVTLLVFLRLRKRRGTGQRDISE